MCGTAAETSSTAAASHDCGQLQFGDMQQHNLGQRSHTVCYELLFVFMGFHNFFSYFLFFCVSIFLIFILYFEIEKTSTSPYNTYAFCI